MTDMLASILTAIYLLLIDPSPLALEDPGPVPAFTPAVHDQGGQP